MQKAKAVVLAIVMVIAVQAWVTSGAAAQEPPQVPPANATRLSDIIARVEKRPNFQYIEHIQWFNDAYIVIFHTTEKAKVEMRFDPVTGQPK